MSGFFKSIKSVLNSVLPKFAENSGASLIGYLPSGTGAVATTVQNQLRLNQSNYINVKDAPYGAKGNANYLSGGFWYQDAALTIPATDDTAALQAAINYACVARRKLFAPSSNYLISAALNIPSSAGWVIYGESAMGTRLVQNTSNTQHLRFSSNLTHSWEISGIGFDYTAQQPVSNTGATSIYFDSGNNTDIFNFLLNDLRFSNARRSIGLNPAASQLAVWGQRFSRITMAGSCTGAFYYGSPAVAVGAPKIAFEQCFLDCESQAETTLVIGAADNVSLKDFEFNNGTYNGFNQMSISTSNFVNLINVKSEVLALQNGAAAWDFPQSNVIASGIKFLAVTTSGTGNSAMMKGDVGGTLNLQGFNGAATGNSCVPYKFTDIKSVSDVTTSGSMVRNTRLVLGNVAAPRLDVDAVSQDRVQTQGDVSVTLVSTDARIQRFNTTLTANRSITLPSTGILDGTVFQIVRDAAVPGAFNLQVVDPISGVNYTIASGAKGWVRYRAVASNQYMIEAAGVL